MFEFVFNIFVIYIILTIAIMPILNYKDKQYSKSIRDSKE